MKKLTIFITLFLFFITSFSQQSTGTSAPKVATDYLNKSKKQKTAAWVMLGGGAGLIIVAALIPEGDPTGEYGPDPFTLISENHEK